MVTPWVFRPVMRTSPTVVRIILPWSVTNISACPGTTDASHRATRTVDEAGTKVAAIESRADRREAEAEANARALRERVAEQVATAQRESEEARREARAEAVRLVGEALIPQLALATPRSAR